MEVLLGLLAIAGLYLIFDFHPNRQTFVPLESYFSYLQYANYLQLNYLLFP